jgi:hypothetical protein
VAPVEFRNATLFAPRGKPTDGEPLVAVNAPTDRPNGAPTPTAKQDAPEGQPRPVTLTEESATALAFVPPGSAEAAPGSDVAKPAPIADEPAKPAPTQPRTRKFDPQPTKRTGQVAVFVSRKERKIFVRQGMVPLFDMPITIKDPDQPLGTHVFTALSVGDGAGMRWNLMTVPTDPVAMAQDRPSRRQGKGKEPPAPVVHLNAPSTAAQALDRIEFPKAAVDRISDLLIPGSSLVVSDTGLGPETGQGTEFIVLTR